MIKVLKRLSQIGFKLPIYCLAFPTVLAIRLVRPFLLVRIGNMVSQRIGHLAANNELYMCELDAGINVPSKRHLDLFFMGEPVSNHQLATMWRRVLKILPTWVLYPIHRVNRLLPGGEIHDIGHNTSWERDVHNLFDRFPAHLEFLPEELLRGESGLRAIGIPKGAPFVCLAVRDSAYLEEHMPNVNWNYHSYRDTDVQDYALAAEELATRGYFVIRMGARVRKPLKSSHPMVIDYAFNGMRSDFLDIYLCAKCAFCVSMGTGIETVPYIFRRPLAIVNSVPLGILLTFRDEFVHISRRHFSIKLNRELSLKEIVDLPVFLFGKTADYESAGIQLINNSPEEIRDVVVEMSERLNGTWQPQSEDEVLQRKFWKIFPSNKPLGNRQLHGSIRSHYGAKFLRSNRWWLE